MKIIKSIALGICVGVAGGTSMAFASDAADALICLRELVNEKGGNQASVSFAYSTMVKLQANIEDTNLIQETMDSCALMKSQIDDNETLNQDEQVNIVSQQGLGRGETPNNTVKSLLMSFIKPQLYCENFTGGFNLGALVALRISGGYRVCTNLDGRRWLRLSIAPGVGYGWAINLDQTHGRSRQKEISRDNLNYTVSKTESIGTGEADTKIKEFMANGYKIPYIQETGDVVGLGATHTVGANLTFTFLPLPLDKNYLLSNFIIKK